VIKNESIHMGLCWRQKLTMVEKWKVGSGAEDYIKCTHEALELRDRTDHFHKKQIYRSII